MKDKNIFEEMSMVYKILFGVSAGLLGMILMLNSVHITADTIIDFRYVSVLIIAIYGGPNSSLIATFIIGIFRLLFLGISKTSVTALIVAIVIGSGIGVIVKQELEKNKEIVFFHGFLFLLLFQFLHLSPTMI